MYLGIMRSLLDLCISFVSCHLRLVDSFEGFPETICENIFKNALNSGTFSLTNEPGSLQFILQVFAESYSIAIRPKLVLSDWKFLALCHDHIQVIFPYLQTIILPNCKIGDSHVVLHSIGQLVLLESLDLSDNFITDEGITQALLQYARRSKKSLNCLKFINLQGNEITNHALKHLVSLPKLQFIKVNMSMTEHSIGLFQNHCDKHAQHIQYLREIKLCDKAHSEYWSDLLLNSWRTEFYSAESVKEGQRNQILNEKNVRSTSLFYKKLKSVPSPCEAAIYQDLSSSNVICLCSYKKDIISRNSVKRKNNTQSHNHGNVKRKKVNDLSEEQLLLDLYS